MMPVLEEHAQRGQSAESIQMEALLLSRTYLYTFFHKLFGGEPDENLLDALFSPCTTDVLEEFSDGDPRLSSFASFLRRKGMAHDSLFTEQAEDEFTRMFLGSAALPASPYESPYRGSHDEALFTENTISVRKAYASEDLQVRRMNAIPDDHISTIFNFMSIGAQKALDDVRQRDAKALASRLKGQSVFADAHLAEWVETYATFVRTSKVGADAVLYPQSLEAAAAFVDADRVFMKEASYWADNWHSETEPLTPICEFQETQKALDELSRLVPFGIEDYQLVPISQKGSDR